MLQYRHILCLGLAFVASVALATPARAENLANLARTARQADAGIFGSAEFQAAALSALPQWNRVLDRLSVEGETLKACMADATTCGTSAMRTLGRAVAEARELPPLQQIDYINKFFNRWPYKLDVEVYGLSEYWATPSEFMIHSGDCEDYGIAKFFALRQLGFSNDQMRVVVVMDTIRQIGHAVLAVYVENDIKILDSLSDAIFSDSFYKHYIPQYSVNETSRWLHVPKPNLLTSKVTAKPHSGVLP